MTKLTSFQQIVINKGQNNDFYNYEANHNNSIEQLFINGDSYSLIFTKVCAHLSHMKIEQEAKAKENWQVFLSNTAILANKYSKLGTSIPMSSFINSINTLIGAIETNSISDLQEILKNISDAALPESYSDTIKELIGSINQTNAASDKECKQANNIPYRIETDEANLKKSKIDTHIEYIENVEGLKNSINKILMNIECKKDWDTALSKIWSAQNGLQNSLEISIYVEWCKILVNRFPIAVAKIFLQKIADNPLNILNNYYNQNTNNVEKIDFLYNLLNTIIFFQADDKVKKNYYPIIKSFTLKLLPDVIQDISINNNNYICVEYYIDKFLLALNHTDDRIIFLENTHKLSIRKNNLYLEKLIVDYLKKYSFNSNVSFKKLHTAFTAGLIKKSQMDKFSH